MGMFGNRGNTGDSNKWSKSEFTSASEQKQQPATSQDSFGSVSGERESREIAPIDNPRDELDALVDTDHAVADMQHQCEQMAQALTERGQRGVMSDAQARIARSLAVVDVLQPIRDSLQGAAKAVQREVAEMEAAQQAFTSRQPS